MIIYIIICIILTGAIMNNILINSKNVGNDDFSAPWMKMDLKNVGKDDFSAPWMKMDLKELEDQYSPSRWSKRFSADTIIDNHRAVAKIRSDFALENVPHRLDISYGDKPRSKLDIFGENLPKDSIILIHVHGGYWQALEKSLTRYPVEPLYKNGILTVILGYTLAPESQLEEIVKEVQQGIRWVCDLARERGSAGIFLMGHSAGAHLITQAMSTIKDNEIEASSLVKGIVCISGVFDVRPLVKTYVNDVLFLNETSAWELSPLKWVNRLSTMFPNFRIFVTAGKLESPEYRRQSLQYCKALRYSGIDCHHEEIEEVDHFNIVEDLGLINFKLTTRIIDFIKNTDKVRK